MPKFDGGSDPEAYFTWELKVDKIFHLLNYAEEKKLAMASLEFEGYALIWWEQLLHDREEDGENPIATWEEMKREMRTRFVAKPYRHDLIDLVYQATKAERQLQHDTKSSKPLSYGTRTMSRGGKSISRFTAAPSSVKSSSGDLCSNVQGVLRGKNAATQGMSSKPSASTTISVGLHPRVVGFSASSV